MTVKINYRNATPVLVSIRKIKQGEFFICRKYPNGNLQQRTQHGAIIIPTGVYDPLTEYTDDPIFEVVNVEITEL